MIVVPAGWPRLAGTNETPDEVELGFIAGVFGVKGEVRLHLHNRDSGLFHKRAKDAVLTVDSARYGIKLKTRSGAGGRVIGRIDGLDNRELAAALKGAVVSIAAERLPQLGEDEFYLRDVIGTEVRIGGDVVGTVVEIHQTGAVDVLELDLGGEETEFVPALHEFVVSISRDGVDLTPEALG